MRNKKTTFELGRIHIESWKPKDGMFSYPSYTDPTDPFYSLSYASLVKDCNPSEQILSPNKTYKLIIDYPVRNHYTAEIKSGKRGVTRIKLIEKICKHYKKMYAEENNTTKIVPRLGKDGGDAPMYNRCETNGKYGIWGHVIGDLLLCDCTIDSKNNITLCVDS